MNVSCKRCVIMADNSIEGLFDLFCLSTFKGIHSWGEDTCEAYSISDDEDNSQQRTHTEWYRLWTMMRTWYSPCSQSCTFVKYEGKERHAKKFHSESNWSQTWDIWDRSSVLYILTNIFFIKYMLNFTKKQK